MMDAPPRPPIGPYWPTRKKGREVVDGKLECVKCREMKPVAEFSKANRGIAKWRGTCKDCFNRDQREAKRARPTHGEARKDPHAGLSPIQVECLERAGICAGCPNNWIESGPCMVKHTPQLVGRL